MARILAVAPDLLFASKIEARLGAAGHEVTLQRQPAPEAIAGAELVIADLSEVDPEGLVAAGVPALGFYRHTDPATRARAEAAGFDLVVPRSRMEREMEALVDTLLASA